MQGKNKTISINVVQVATLLFNSLTLLLDKSYFE